MGSVQLSLNEAGLRRYSQREPHRLHRRILKRVDLLLGLGEHFVQLRRRGLGEPLCDVGLAELERAQRLTCAQRSGNCAEAGDLSLEVVGGPRARSHLGVEIPREKPRSTRASPLAVPLPP